MSIQIIVPFEPSYYSSGRLRLPQRLAAEQCKCIKIMYANLAHFNFWILPMQGFGPGVL
jgi:hypothetical protein